MSPILPRLSILFAVVTMLGCQPDTGTDPGTDPSTGTSAGSSSEADASGPSWQQQGADYLKSNASQPGVVTLESGLQYKVIREGTGNSPAATDSVEVHYAGKLINGTEFDSSYKRGEPATFPVNRVIAGWTEGLQLMKEGAKWELTIPAELGYGSRGTGRSIPADSVLVFEVELLKVK